VTSSRYGPPQTSGPGHDQPPPPPTNGPGQPGSPSANGPAGAGAPQTGGGRDPGGGYGGGSGHGSGHCSGLGTAEHGGGVAGATADSERARAALNRLRTEVGKVVVGQDPAVTGLVIALLCRGHVLLEGVPGVAKTLMVRALSAALTLETKRLQFTPDLMPGDVTGSLIYDARNAQFSFRPGPVFTNLLLADEINRTPPKTQASLLEAMEERQVSVEGQPRPLPDPFVVVATQNPIEYEGTYPLPEAQLDRFLLKLTVPLPSRDEEFRVLNNHHRGFDPRNLAAAGVTPVADAADLAAGQAAVRGVQAAAEVLAYVVDLCRATRQSPSLSLGASPRGATALLSTAKAWAWLSGRDYVTPDDVKALARPTLRHRVAVRPEAELEGVTADGVLDSVLAAVPAPR
jgi:MoxR-like ATPase